MAKSFRIIRRAPIAALMVFMFAFTALLSGCFDTEPEERAAFIEVLQNRILAKKSRSFMVSGEERKKIGRYETQLKFLADAVDANKLVGKFNELSRMQQQVERNNDLMERSKAIDELILAFGDSQKTAQDELANAVAERALFQQPDDLKPVFDAAFEQLIAEPLDILQDVFGKAKALIESAKELNDYAINNPDSVEVRGNNYNIKKASAEKKIQALIEDRNNKLKEMNESINRLNKMR